MKFVIQYNLMRNDHLIQIKEAIKEYPHEFVSVLPFSEEIKSDNDLIGEDYIPYGSTLFVKLAKRLNWKGLYFDENKFNYSEALKNRNDMLNDNVITIKEAIKIIENQKKNSEWFIRPSHDLKQFSGMVLTAEKCLEWFNNVINIDSEINLDTEVVLTKNKQIKAEWRWFVIGRKAISGSMYRFKENTIKERVVEKNLIDEAQEFANKWLPHENCVMDLALVGDELKVIEFNGINASGFYNHDVKLIFDSIWKYEQEDNITFTKPF